MRRINGLLLCAAVFVNMAMGESPKTGPTTEDVFRGRPVLLAKQMKPLAAIVSGAQTRPSAMTLQKQVKEKTGIEFPVVSDENVVSPGRFDYRDEWSQKTLILVGQVETNRAFLALYARYLVGENRGYPGVGRYVVRTLLEPFSEGADLVVVGASDAAGLQAGVARAAAILAAGLDKDGTCALKPLIEVGDATGPVADRSAYGGRGLDAFYWGGNLAAGLQVKTAFLKQLEGETRDLKPWSGDHYTWEARYRELLKMLAAGIFEVDQVVQIQNRMAENLLHSTDAWGKRALVSSPEEWTRSVSRHSASAFTGQLLLADYLHHVAKLDPEKKKEVARCHDQLRSILEELARQRRSRGGIEGSEGLEVLENLTNLLFYLGDEGVLRSGVLSEMMGNRLATRDNLGCHAGVDSYIGSRPGCHFDKLGPAGLAAALASGWLSDPQALAIRALDPNPLTVLYLGVIVPPAFAAPDPQRGPAEPTDFTGVQILPLDGFFSKFIAEFPARAEDFTRCEPPAGVPYDKAVFRDGFGENDAYLLIQGLNVSTPMFREGIYANAIIRYTDLGSLLLFSNTQVVGSWARSLVRISRGAHDAQSASCMATGSFRGRTVSILQSLQEQNGGTAWERTIVRRREGYFVVLDHICAREEDNYHVSCQWRSYHPGEFSDRQFVATDRMNQTEMHLVSAGSHPTELVQAGRDGSADPLLVRQVQNGRLAKGDSVTFENLLYATRPDIPRQFDVRWVRPGCVLVQGQTGRFQELAVVSLGGIDGLAGVRCDGGAVYVSRVALCAVAVRKITWPGTTIESSGPMTIEVPEDRSAFIVENPNREAVRLRIAMDGEAENTRDMPRGSHRLDIVKRFPDGASIHAALEALWKQAGTAPRPGADPAAAVPLAAPVAEPAWQQATLKPSPRAFHGFRLSLSPEKPGETKLLVDRDHHRWSPVVGLPGKGGWELTFEFARPTAVESIRLVGYRSGTPLPPGIRFDAVVEGDAETRRIENIEPVHEFWYSQMEKYLETAAHPTLRIPIGLRATKITVRAQPRDDARTTYGIQEARVFISDPQARAVSCLRTLRDAQGDALVLVGADEVLRLDATGKVLWRWKSDSEILHHFVDYSNVEKCWLIGAWPASQRVALLDGAGNVVLSPETFDKGDNARLLNGHFRAHAVTLWECVRDKPGIVAFFPHYSFGRIRREPEGVKFETMEGRGGKAVLRIPDITGDGCEDLFVVGRYENNNGVIPSEYGAGAQGMPADGINWIGNQSPNWTGWSSGNMELTLYHGVSAVSAVEAGGQTRGLGVVGVNPGGMDFYESPSYRRVWGHFSHPGNLCHAVGDVVGDGVEEILVGREDGFLVVYDAPTGEVRLKVDLADEVRAVAVAGKWVAAGTSRGLFLVDADGKVRARAEGPVESVCAVRTPSGVLFVASFSDGSVRAFRQP